MKDWYKPLLICAACLGVITAGVLLFEAIVRMTLACALLHLHQNSTYMAIHKNMGRFDRTLRFIVGVVLVGLYFFTEILTGTIGTIALGLLHRAHRHQLRIGSLRTLHPLPVSHLRTARIG